jgi:GNAT superfamily N-acetyltransferase
MHWVHDNPAIEMRGSDFTNDPWVIALNDRMTSINSCLAVDLTGQVASDTLLGKFFSGIGGQVDFVRGAARSREGKSIIALPSTAKQGTVSRIQATLDQGAGVVTSRGDVRYIVTEYGIADLWGKSIRERAMALISVAHPDFRRELSDAAKQRRYAFADDGIPRANYPWNEVRDESLRDGTPVQLTPVRLTDEPSLQAFLYGLSNESTYRRYLCHKRTHPHEELQDLVNVDYHDTMALIVRESGTDAIIGISRYDLDRATNFAEVVFTVADTWQGRGAATLLFRRMAQIAYANGIAGFYADVLASNTPMLRVFHRSGHKVRISLDAGTYHLEVLFDPEQMRDRGVDADAQTRASRPPIR